MSSKEYHREWQKKHRKKCPNCGEETCYSAKLCKKCSARGERASRWKGGRYKHKGYVLVHVPTHPNAGVGGYIHEHRIVMESHLGRTLLPTEVVHHINGDREDNRIENLMLFSSRGEHMSLHHKLRKLAWL